MNSIRNLWRRDPFLTLMGSILISGVLLVVIGTFI